MTKENYTLNKQYIWVVSLLTFIFPIIFTSIQFYYLKSQLSLFPLFGKWFIFFAVGIRLFVAGIKQSLQPGFTAKVIFHIEGEEVYPIVRELGFANICFGLIGILSVYFPSWRIVSAFASGLYYGIAGVQHFLKPEKGINEKFALITDLLIFIVLFVYVIWSLKL